MKITDPRAFGRVAVVMGGNSAEREVSLRSGAGVLNALRSKGVDAHPVDGIPALLDAVRAGHYARVFNILHGRGGEDGMLQGALDALHVPYTGSGVLGSAVGMDKLRTKRLAGALGVPTPEYAVLRSAADLPSCIERLGLPLIVKPATQGSSVGMTKVEQPEALAPAYQSAAVVDHTVFAEAWITGGEYTVAMLHGEALP